MRITLSFALAALAAIFVTPALAQCPNLGVNGPVFEYSGDDLRRGIRTEVIAGTSLVAWDCDSIRMVGYVDPAPTLTLNLSDMGARGLEVTVESTCDPTLLVQLPNGQVAFIDDDSSVGRGLDPAIRLPAMGDGQYDIWVGSYSDFYCLADVRIRTRN